eukprot:3554347-Prymnesium_polylepis.1
MASRAATDGAGLSVVKSDDAGAGKARPLLKAPVLSQGKQQKKKKYDFRVGCDAYDTQTPAQIFASSDRGLRSTPTHRGVVRSDPRVG